MEILWILIWAVIWGVICKVIGDTKGINGFWWGFFLGIIGFVIVLCMGDKRDTPQSTIVVPNQNQIPSQMNKYEQLEKLAKLKEQGALSDDEFEKEKARILNS